LDINARKNTDNYTVNLLQIIASDSANDTWWKVVEWSESQLTNNTGSIALDANSAVVFRSTYQKAGIERIVFSVTDDDGKTIVYWSGTTPVGVKSTTIGDFASLTL
jgi:hypothetical protein